MLCVLLLSLGGRRFGGGWGWWVVGRESEVEVEVVGGIAVAAMGGPGIVVVVVVEEIVLEMDGVGVVVAGSVCFAAEAEARLSVWLFCLGLERMALEEGVVEDRMGERWDLCSRSRGRTLFVISC